MRLFIFCAILLLGAAVGLLPAIATGRDWGAGLITMCFGIAFAAPIASLLTGVGRVFRRPRRPRHGVGFSGTTGSASDGVVRIRRWDR